MLFGERFKIKGVPHIFSICNYYIFQVEVFGRWAKWVLSIPIDVSTFVVRILSSLFCSMGGLKGSEDWHQPKKCIEAQEEGLTVSNEEFCIIEFGLGLFWSF